jgi:hypothetical protein
LDSGNAARRLELLPADLGDRARGAALLSGLALLALLVATIWTPQVEPKKA